MVLQRLQFGRIGYCYENLSGLDIGHWILDLRMEKIFLGETCILAYKSDTHIGQLGHSAMCETGDGNEYRKDCSNQPRHKHHLNIERCPPTKSAEGHLGMI